jgi:hypothetical protein
MFEFRCYEVVFQRQFTLSCHDVLTNIFLLSREVAEEGKASLAVGKEGYCLQD